jgi:hypothetical protein
MTTWRPKRVGRRLGRNMAKDPPPPVEEREGGRARGGRRGSRSHRQRPSSKISRRTTANLSTACIFPHGVPYQEHEARGGRGILGVDLWRGLLEVMRRAVHLGRDRVQHGQDRGKAACVGGERGEAVAGP